MWVWSGFWQLALNIAIKPKEEENLKEKNLASESRRLVGSDETIYTPTE